MWWSSGLELGAQLDALQGVVGVAAFPLHQGLAPSSGLRVGLADVIFVQQCQRQGGQIVELKERGSE